MSHSRERAEKICLNCNAELLGRYCYRCGQENIEPRQSLWALLSHFFEDITHFDGKFFQTAGLLARKPGFLPAEYVRGRRASYLHPIRMYVFTSAVFFLVFYSTFSGLQINDVDSGNPVLKTDSADRDQISIVGQHYSSAKSYDSLQQTLPADQKDGWFVRQMIHRSIRINQEYKGRSNDLFHILVETFLHTLPYLLFVSLPLYALYLKLLYFRKRFMYTDHAIFLIYLYIFTFIVLLAGIALMKLGKLHPQKLTSYLLILLLVYGVVYTVLSMKRFYSDRTGRVIGRFIIFNILSFFTAIILFLAFFVLTLFRI